MKKQNSVIAPARALIKKGEYVEAEALLLEALEQDEGMSIIGMLADLYIKTGNLHEARKYCERILSQEPSNAYALEKKGDILAKEGKLKEGLAIFEELYRSTRDDIFLIKRLARVHFLLKDFPAALEYVQKGLELAPARADLYYQRAQILEEMEEYTEAGKAIEEALLRAPGNSFYYSKKLSLRVKEKGLASSDIEEMIHFNDTEDPALLKTFIAKLKKEGEYDKAVDACKKLISCEDTEYTRKQLAYLYYKMKEYDRAFSTFMSCPDTCFGDTIFVTTITASAQSNENRGALIQRMKGLAEGDPRYRHLWGRIKKLGKGRTDEKDS